MITKDEHGGQAFPSHPMLYSSADAGEAQGMTLRDWFAGQALPAIIAATCAGQHTPGSEGRTGIVGMADDAYELADAMLAARKAGA